MYTKSEVTVFLRGRGFHTPVHYLGMKPSVGEQNQSKSAQERQVYFQAGENKCNCFTEVTYAHSSSI